jgi:hypothetical protein
VNRCCGRPNPSSWVYNALVATGKICAVDRKLNCVMDDVKAF